MVLVADVTAGLVRDVEDEGEMESVAAPADVTDEIYDSAKLFKMHHNKLTLMSLIVVNPIHT